MHRTRYQIAVVICHMGFKFPSYCKGSIYGSCTVLRKWGKREMGGSVDSLEASPSVCAARIYEHQSISPDLTAVPSRPGAAPHRVLQLPPGGWAAESSGEHPSSRVSGSAWPVGGTGIGGSLHRSAHRRHEECACKVCASVPVRGRRGYCARGGALLLQLCHSL